MQLEGAASKNKLFKIQQQFCKITIGLLFTIKFKINLNVQENMASHIFYWSCLLILFRKYFNRYYIYFLNIMFEVLNSFLVLAYTSAFLFPGAGGGGGRNLYNYCLLKYHYFQYHLLILVDTSCIPRPPKLGCTEFTFYKIKTSVLYESQLFKIRKSNVNLSTFVFRHVVDVLFPSMSVPLDPFYLSKFFERILVMKVSFRYLFRN
uniref:Uncharacterized protein n=1 Tax=Heterorhabditis bacteriophora TaxID=37862 RepID=A0A1I7W8H1_HETBA